MSVLGVSVECNNAYWHLVRDIMTRGVDIPSRNSITKRRRNKIKTFTETPLVSLRRTAWISALREMEWFLSGSNNIRDLHDSVRKWWEPWSNNAGYINNNYGKQFRRYEGAGHCDGGTYPYSIDQVKYMINTIKKEPYSRRNVISTWHTLDMISQDTPITNCHGTVIQTFVEYDELHLTMYQRSCDIMLGVPHNWIQYWAFLMWLASRTNKKVGSFTWVGGDCHIYDKHFEVANRLINGRSMVDSPKLVYVPTGDDFKAIDFKLSGDYEPIIKENLEMIV